MNKTEGPSKGNDPEMATKSTAVVDNVLKVEQEASAQIKMEGETMQESTDVKNGEVKIEEGVDLQTEVGDDRQSDGFQSKRRQNNPIWSKYNKRKKYDSRIQPSNGHLMFEEKEYPLLEYTDYLQAQMETEAHFNKKFSFNKPPEGGSEAWTLPPVDTMFTKPVWQDEELQASKVTLNKIKQQLTDKDVNVWHTHTKNTNPAEKIAFAARRRANPEMVTQAWLKFYEILGAYPITPQGEQLEETSEEDKENAIKNGKPFNSVHLCEAPGAFIVALNHFLAANRPLVKWRWLGNTLNPYYEGSPAEVCVVEDRLIYLTLEKWSFGVDNTGDLMEPNNLEDIIQRSENIGPIHLVSADGSVDCQTDPANQEITTHGLHFCEIVTAMSVLAPGGTFVVKKFTMFESDTINLMYLLCCVFEEVHILKPGTSKEGNSEVYAICLKYCGKEMCAAHLKKLVEVYGTCSNNLTMFSLEDLPKEFLLQLRKCTEVFKAHQINTINKNVSQFENMTERDQQYIDLLKFKATTMFFQQSRCVRITKERTMTDSKVNKSRYLLETDLNKPITSSIVRTKCPHKKLSLLKKYMTIYIEEFSKRNWIIDLTKGESCDVARLASLELESLKFEVIRGKPVEVIKFSKFCSPKIQEAHRELWKLWESLDDPPVLNVDDSLMEIVLKEYPETEVLKTEVTPGPLGQLGALKEALLRLKEGKMSSGSSLILFNVTLLSRLQCGVLFLLGSAFCNIVVYSGKDLGTQIPVIILEKFKSVEHGAAVINALHKAGWNPFDGKAACSQEVLQLVSYSTLVENLKLCSVFYYNLHHWINRSLMLQNALDKKLVAKSELGN